jgi:hypothetical protein
MHKLRNQAAAQARGEREQDFTNYFFIHFGFYEQNAYRDQEYQRRALGPNPGLCARKNGRVI